MNTTFMTWMVVAAVLGGVLLLLLAGPVTEPEEPVQALVGEAAADPVGYWEPVTSATPVAEKRPTTTLALQHPGSAACPVCSPTSPAPVRSPISTITPAYTPPATRAGCSRPASACAPAPCAGLPTQPASSAACSPACPWIKPGINRNTEICVSACTMIQLYSTVPQPICPDVRFAWTASRGEFLDPRAPNPLYFTPATHQPEGEEVWIVLKITDGSGAQYVDQIKLHVSNAW